MTMKIDPEERDRLLTEGGKFVYRELLSHALRGLGRPAEDDPDRLRQRVAHLEGERCLGCTHATPHASPPAAAAAG